MRKEIDRYLPDYTLFDLETTGTSFKTDAVIEISALKVRGGRIADEFSTLVNPRRPIPVGASVVNNITDDMVADAPVFGEVLDQFLDFAGTDPLVGHNIRGFDLRFIDRDARDFYGLIVENDTVDTLVMARGCLPQLTRRNLGALAAFYGIPVRGAHRAMNDCRVNKRVYEQLGVEMDAAEAGERSLRLCPECGRMLKLREGKYGQFWGCSGYPGCRHTESA